MAARGHRRGGGAASPLPRGPAALPGAARSARGEAARKRSCLWNRRGGSGGRVGAGGGAGNARLRSFCRRSRAALRERGGAVARALVHARQRPGGRRAGTAGAAARDPGRDWRRGRSRGPAVRESAGGAQPAGEAGRQDRGAAVAALPRRERTLCRAAAAQRALRHRGARLRHGGALGLRARPHQPRRHRPRRPVRADLALPSGRAARRPRPGAGERQGFGQRHRAGGPLAAAAPARGAHDAPGAPASAPGRADRPAPAQRGAASIRAHAGPAGGAGRPALRGG